jgi:predicted Zn-dependent protease
MLVMPLRRPSFPSLRRSLAAMVALSLLVAPGSGVVQAQAMPSRALPALGDAASEDLTVGAERHLGDRIMQELRRDPDVIDDPLLFDYLQSLWQPLVSAARARGEVSADIDQRYAWEPFLVRDRSINAFALPGGYIGVHLGLIAMTATRDELASVLAHELSHVTQRHIARSIAVNRRQSILGIATMILGVMAAARSTRGDGANAAIMGGQAMMVQGQLNFSRDMEREADRVGFGVLQSAGFEPLGMVAMFERLQQASRLMDSQQYPYLRSHPLTSERIGEARSRLGLQGAALSIEASELPDANRWLQAAMQGRARALMDGRTEVLQRLAAVPLTGTTPEAFANSYAAALAAERLKDWKTADAALMHCQTLTARQPAADRAVVMLQAEMALDRGRPAEAQRLVADKLADGSRAVLLLAARSALAVNGPSAGLRDQAEGLQTWVANRPGDATAWALLSQLHNRLGEPLAGLRAEAESHWASGDLNGAIDRLRAGQRMARASGSRVEAGIDASVIEARLKVMEQQRRAQRIEDGEEPRG